jgi:hypothetical protein
LLTHLARAAIGLDVSALDSSAAAAAVRSAYNNAFMTFGFGAGGDKADSEYWKGVCALLGAALNDAEVVALCTGGKTLGGKVQRSKTYVTVHGDHDLKGLARHLAIAARARASWRDVEAAMTPLRASFAEDKLRDPRVALVAASAWLTHVAVAPDVAVQCKAWLDGKPMELPETSNAIAGPADGEDPRTKIFEKFAPRLANEQYLAHMLEDIVETKPSWLDYRPFVPDHPSEAATVLYVARRTLPAKWDELVDPHVARWLGAKVSDAKLAARRKKMLAENREYKDPKRVRAFVVRGMSLHPAVRALVLGNTGVLTAFTGGGTLAPFKPGKYFKDDWRKLLRYLAAAMKVKKVTREDVEPAWFDFLARPFTENVNWCYLLAMQSIITVNVGGGAPEDVGRDLQRVITGV